MDTKTYEWRVLSTYNSETVSSGTINLSQEPKEGNYLEIGDGDWVKIDKVVLRQDKPTLLVC